MVRHALIWIPIFAVMTILFFRLPQMAAKQDAVVNTYSALVEVDALAKQRFVELVDDDRLVDGAIRGMLLQLDPYSGYIAPGHLPAFERRASGDFIGIGIEVGIQNGRLIVIAPVEGSPAAAAGVLPGDLVLSINGRDVEGLSVFDAEELLGGPAGTTISLRVQHAGQPEPESLTVVRGPVNLRTVRGFRRDASGRFDYMIDEEERIGYVRISSFLCNTMRDFDGVLRRLLADGVRALIIDVRFNPGGVMQQAVALVDRFVTDGVIVSTVTRRQAVQTYPATVPGTIADVDLVVLINGASASAAEIVAGSLQAHGRATIVGERSFGKGSVQHLIHLTGSKGAVKLTTAHYRLPDGRIIHRTKKNAHTDSWGVIPDTVIALDDSERRMIRDSRQALDQAFTERADEEAMAPMPDSAASALGDPFAVEAAAEAPLGSGAGPSPRPSQTVAHAIEIHLDRQLEAALDQLRDRLRGKPSERARAHR